MTYDLVTAPVPAMARDDYARLAKQELQELLDSGECDESRFQALLEDHPILVPGVYPSLDTGHNGIFPGGVISQPPLTALQSKIPDFCVLSTDSGTLYATFVEIESPCKPWATKSGAQSAQLTQAIQQLRDWKIWFSDPLNAARFVQEYRIPYHMRQGRAFRQNYVLVYGRRAEFEAAEFQRRRDQAQASDETFMTWDRVAPSIHYLSILTVRLTPAGFLALRVPPTLLLGPMDAEEFALIDGKQAALDASRHFTPERRAFLKERWPYWDDWARAQRGTRRSPVRASDFE